MLLGVVLLIGALIAVGMHFGRGGDDAISSAGDDAAAAAGRVATGPARAGETLFSRLGGMWTASARVRELENENRELQSWRELAQRLAERNARYEALLRMPKDAFGDSAEIENAIAAQLVLDSGGPFRRTLVANAGGEHGVRVGYIAVNENGLVGRVVSVGRRSSRVLMLDDYNSRIPVMGEASRVRAVLAGQATRAPELVTSPFQLQAPRLDFIVGVDSLREGERVITSGDGGLFPRGILVGVAHQQGEQWRVSLSAAQRPIDFVRLIPFVGVTAPESEQVADAGPPMSAVSSSGAVSRGTMAPPPSQPSGAVGATAPPRRAPTPRPQATEAPAPQPAATEAPAPTQPTGPPQ